MFCEECGAEIPKGAKFCEKCGSQVEPDIQEGNANGSPKKWIFGGIAGVIAVAVVIVVVLFATGTFGGDKKNMQTSSGSTLSDTDASEPVTQSEEPTDPPAIASNPAPVSTENSDKEPASENSGKEPASDKPDPEPATDNKTDFSEPDAEIPDVSMKYLQSVTATSELYERNMVHSASRICDKKLKNAWVEGASGQGVGEEVTFVFDDSYSFSGMKIHAGYQKTEDLYYKNSRPQQLKITFADNKSKMINLDDYYGVQKIDFDAPIVADQVTVTIESVYAGNKYKDTVISELEWY